MKKFLSLFLAAIMLFALLISCSAPQDTDTNSSDSANMNDTSSDNASGGNTSSPEDQTEPPDDNQPEDPDKPAEKTHTVTYQFNYSYDHIFVSETNEPLTYLLIEHSDLGRGFDNIVIPDDIAAGDTITIEYTGETEHLESYPGVINLLNGEVKSYSFGYAEVTHLEGSDFSIEKIKDCYEYKDAYVILDRSGRFVKLDEYTETEIYLVTDQKELYEDDLGGIQDLPAPLKHPVACMLAYNPRDSKDGAPVKTVAKLRNEKVFFDLDFHNLENEESKVDDSAAKNDRIEKRDFGYIGKNGNGNEYIVYAPSCSNYTYVIRIFSKGDLSEARELVISLDENKSFSINEMSYTNCNALIVDIPDFDTYSKIQEELLNGLSSIEDVEKIEISYVKRNHSDSKVNGYDLYTTRFVPICGDNKLITSYEQFTKLFDLTDEKNAFIASITEDVFESSYVLYVSEFSYCSGVRSIKDVALKDAMLIDNTLYLTKYEHFTGIHEQATNVTVALVIIPKTEIGALVTDEFAVNFVDIEVNIGFENLD
ncbi:MAG: hypothetical protein II984_08960 [Clostridia bacterium]|nr:hypothetical protein [Clostridia bacterium]